MIKMKRKEARTVPAPAGAGALSRLGAEGGCSLER